MQNMFSFFSGEIISYLGSIQFTNRMYHMSSSLLLPRGYHIIVFLSFISLNKQLIETEVHCKTLTTS